MTDSLITGTVDAITVDNQGVLISFVPIGKASTAPVFGDCSFRLDASSRYLTMMLDLAKFAMANGLTVIASGQGDEREGSLVLNDIRIFKHQEA